MSKGRIQSDAARVPEPTVAGPDFVRSLERGLAVIRAFDSAHPELTLSDVARATGLTRAAARRFLHTLVELGYVRNTGRLFSLRPRILELGHAYLSSLGLSEVATPHLEALVASVHESSSISVLDGDEVVYVARVPMRRIMTVVISVGTRFPAYATSMGRVLLAGQSDDWLEGYLATAQLLPLTRHTITDSARLRTELMRVREQGWSLVDEELEEGLRSIATAIHDSCGKVIAAINVSALARQGDIEEMRQTVLPHLLIAAHHIEDDIHAMAPGGAPLANQLPTWARPHSNDSP